jgi:tRNA dimethylallyltransferase
MDIGTAKPTAAERAAAAHHLIDVVDPDQPFSLGTWLDLAKDALEDIWSRSKQPVLVGGTGQYAWALIEGWRVPRVEPNAELREELASRPAAELLAELRRVDPEAESYIDPRNVRRVIRALEVQAETGKPFSYWRTKEPPPFEAKVIGIRVPRDELYARIGRRVDAMIEAGFIDEVRTLLNAGYTRELPSMSGIGYAEVCAHLAGELTLAEAVERTKTGTHRLARHQHAWFKERDERIRWVEAGAWSTSIVKWLRTGLREGDGDGEERRETLHGHSAARDRTGV